MKRIQIEPLWCQIWCHLEGVQASTQGDGQAATGQIRRLRRGNVLSFSCYRSHSGLISPCPCPRTISAEDGDGEPLRVRLLLWMEARAGVTFAQVETPRSFYGKIVLWVARVCHAPARTPAPRLPS